MNFRAINEPPFAISRPGVPRRLLGFVIFSLLLHSLLFIAGDDITPLDMSPLGTPYIHAILSNGLAISANNDPAPNSDRPSEKPPAVEMREIPHDAPKPEKIKTTADSQREIAHIRETPTPSSVEAETQTPLNTAATHAETPPETAATITNDGYADTRQQTLSAIENPTEKNAQSTAQTDTDSQHNYLLGQLQDQLSHYLTYPLRARRRGWEGEVLLSLQLDAHGQLHNIQLLRSSGYALLDRSALRALSRLDRLRLPADAAARKPVDLQLPVVYRLSEG